ncbi:MAG: hypothetical protein COA78_07155 [Blastopirellula sp.]|nr:MAG: hypothetical protein COA78_07155 [Blastopirellula sp.]
MNKQNRVGYTTIHALYKQVLGQMIEDNYTPDRIIGLGRGGLDMAVKFSHHFKVPMDCLMMQTRDGNTVMPKYQDLAFKETNILIVDDICDSGKTMRLVKPAYADVFSGNLKVAVAYTDVPHTLDGLVDYYGSVIDRTTNHLWYVFPWENTSWR